MLSLTMNDQLYCGVVFVSKEKQVKEEMTSWILSWCYYSFDFFFDLESLSFW